MPTVHPTALVDPQARLADDVVIGPYAIVGPQVTLGAGTQVGAHAVIGGRTTIGRNNRIFAHAALGGEPQDKKYRGEDTELVIGDDNTIREFCTFNTGTAQGGGITRVGNDNWVMAYVHVAHDVIVGDHCILANNASLAGHAVVGDWVILGGLTGVHQFVRIGAHAMTGGASLLLQDLPPYVICQGNPAAPHGLNSEGLKRRGFAPEAVAQLRRAYKLIYREGLTVAQAADALLKLAAEAPEHRAHVDALRTFVQESTRGILR
ncbi:MAG: acyl-ACP--UDP-N-acetylglucosamine O-acyltransferase [Burkholderiaceae bacterium]|jgi:UDP-N-acetylglucosamine acyltransferase|nr:acyl-ACP--UDP-N-acetylglucosamine O-acyltransferase [Burkholderiaceae bacterium]